MEASEQVLGQGAATGTRRSVGPVRLNADGPRTEAEESWAALMVEARWWQPLPKDGAVALVRMARLSEQMPTPESARVQAARLATLQVERVPWFLDNGWDQSDLECAVGAWIDRPGAGPLETVLMWLRRLCLLLPQIPAGYTPLLQRWARMVAGHGKRPVEGWRPDEDLLRRFIATTGIDASAAPVGRARLSDSDVIATHEQWQMVLPLTEFGTAYLDLAADGISLREVEQALEAVPWRHQRVEIVDRFRVLGALGRSAL